MTQSIPEDAAATSSAVASVAESKKVRALERTIRRLTHRNQRIEEINENNIATSLALRRKLEEDVEERELMLVELSHQKDLAEAATQAKAAFLANVSHEIRTPMNGVIGMLELLRDTKLSADQDDLAHTAYTSAHQLLELIGDLLNFSKIEAGRVDLESKPFVTRMVLDECIDVVRLKAHRQGLNLQVSVDASCPYGIIGDAARLRQVVLNLLNNAVKFTPRGSVVLRARYDASRCTLHVEVEDSGVGISEDRVTHIFEPFSQADSSVTRRFGGTGLGLSISKSLVQLMGGEIEVRSVPGQGSTFSFFMKASQAELQSPVPASEVGYCMNDTSEGENLQDILLMLGCTPFMVAPSEVERVAQERWVFTDQPFPGCNASRLLRVSCTESSDDGAYSLSPLSMRLVADRLRPRQSPPRSPSSPSEQQRSLRILVAEDNRINQAVITRFLQREGHAVQIAEDGVAALEQLASQTFDLVLMDCQMPRMSGFEAAQHVRAGTRHPDLPIIAITANAGESDHRACLASGMDDYLTKPIQFEALREVLKKLPRSGAAPDGPPG